jgi:geranyl-CoA carboxylase alpha subunit
VITKVLVANRGEIACRIIQSVQAAGYAAVAVHSDVDSRALFVGLADESVSLGGNTSAESYLDMDKIIAAAKASGAEAIHPGYGFLSENAEFSAKCREHNITFIGPSAQAIEVMGNKAEAKRLMVSSDVPCIPGYQGEEQDDATLVREAELIGYPLMVKAAAGGGGRGIRLVNSRHIEIQVAADRHGNVIHLFERDCSAQRRHQKVIEEAPSPFMTAKVRAAMGQAAVNAAKAVNYEGVGTVEFLVDAGHNFYFLEMNTRLQVEHPVTELITGVDLVDWQLQIADGQTLPLGQDDIGIDGHAIEVRIYAEDPANGFMPQTGVLRVFEPSEEPGVRIDHGVYSGAVVSPYYDSMLAKVITWGKDREEARRRLIRALTKTRVLGLTTNKTFLIQLLGEEQFVAGEATTAFINEAVLDRANPPVVNADLALAAVLLHQNQNPLSGWSNTEPMLRTETLLRGEHVHSIKVLQTARGYQVFIEDEVIEIDDVSCFDTELVYTLDGVTREAAYSIDDDHISIDLGQRVVNFTRTTYQPVVSQDAAGSGQVKATTEGLVVAVMVKTGDRVSKGDTLVVIEAMKMEHRHIADADGVVGKLTVEKGQQVKNRQVLVELELAEVEGESA